MAIDHRQLYATPSFAQQDAGAIRRVVRELAAQDWLVFAYLVALNVACLQAPASSVRTMCLERVFGLLTFLVTTLVVVRGGLLRHAFWAPLLYRLAIYGTVQLSYFFFQDLLPIVNAHSLDLELYHLDLALFGFEPAMLMDRIVTPFTTEWFAFFYFGYFFLLALHVIPILMFSRQRRLLAEFALGMLIVFCVGHTVYMLVPGYGPYKAMAEHFQNSFPRGMWLDMVMTTVTAGGAQKDIFPSLHTAAPTFMALFSFRHRDKLPFRYTWPAVTFFAVNIICATMFLRWHYIVDVVAGLTLASSAIAIAVYVVRRDALRRSAAGLTWSWPMFAERRTRQELASEPTSAAPARF
ncbi:MAG TPA: phosphatase PAP2 family protein [Polyangiaceae bacterium]|nr:phosphatase PAP2 family protein [Polyangiaceae bacterium]